MQQRSFCTKAVLGQGVTLRGDPGLGQELLLGCRWHWELQEKEHQPCHHPWSRHCTSWEPALPLWPLQQYSPSPGIFLNIFLHSLRRYTALEQGEDQKCSCELLSEPCCHQKPPAWQWTPGFVFVGRKKACSVSHSVCTSLLASVKLLWCYRWDSVAELSLKPLKFGVFVDILMKGLSMMANTFSPKQWVVIPVCSVHCAHGGVMLGLLEAVISAGWWCYSLILEDCQWWALQANLKYPLETCEGTNVTQKDDVTVLNGAF